MKKFLKDHATLIALILMTILLGLMDSSLMDSSFLTPRNFSNITRQVTIIGIIAIGMTGVILLGGIDLSVGSIVGVSAISVTLLMQHGVNAWLAIILTIFTCGVLIGMWNGFWIAHYKIPAFIITLSTMTAARGLAMIFSSGGSIGVSQNDTTFTMIDDNIPINISLIIILAAFILFAFITYRNIQEKKKYNIEIKKADLITSIIMGIAILAVSYFTFVQYQGIPVPVAIFVTIAIIGSLVLRKTRFGRRVYALGGNEEAARLSGINVYATKIIIFTIVTALSAVSGILQAARLGSANPNLGTMYELDAIAAVVIGGTSLSGGSGTIIGTIIGTFIIGILNNGMSLLSVPSFYQLVIKGFIILLAVWFDVVNKQKKV